MGAVFFVGSVILRLLPRFLFFLGLILLIVGIVRKRKPQYAGKKSPTVCIVSGTICLLPLIGAAIYLAWYYGEGSYAHVTDGWRSGRYIAEDRAKEEAIEGLLTAADAGDRDYFEKMFTPKLRERSDFQRLVDAFFESYPNGLSLCERSEHWGNGINNALFTCFLDGEWYSMKLELCYGRRYTPDDVGVTFFCIENLEAYAIDRDYGEDDFLLCEIVDESEVTARLIYGRGSLFTPTPDRSITVEEMKSYLEQYDDLDDLTARIGEPNVDNESKYSNDRHCYYELVPEDGEPRYAYINVKYDGKFYYSYICSDVGWITDITD